MTMGRMLYNPKGGSGRYDYSEKNKKQSNGDMEGLNINNTFIQPISITVIQKCFIKCSAYTVNPLVLVIPAPLLLGAVATFVHSIALLVVLTLSMILLYRGYRASS
jgi:hypothetical protein